MGMLIMSPKNSNYTKFDSSLLIGFKDAHSQGLVYGMMKPLYLRFGFVYLRPGTGTKKQIDTLLNSYNCKDCDVIIGDLNLNPRNFSENERIQFLSRSSSGKIFQRKLIIFPP